MVKPEERPTTYDTTTARNPVAPPQVTQPVNQPAKQEKPKAKVEAEEKPKSQKPEPEQEKRLEVVPVKEQPESVPAGESIAIEDLGEKEEAWLLAIVQNTGMLVDKLSQDIRPQAQHALSVLRPLLNETMAIWRASGVGRSKKKHTASILDIVKIFSGEQD